MKLTTASETAISRITFVYVILLLAFESFVIGVNYASYLAYVIETESPAFIPITLGCLAAAFFLQYNLIRFALSTGWLYRTVTAAILGSAFVIEYGYLKALGRETIATDIETAIATTSDQRSASLLMYFSFYSLIPIAVLLALFCFIRAEKKQGVRQFVLANGLLAGLFAISPTLIDQPFPTFSGAAFYRTATEFMLSGAGSSSVFASTNSGMRARRPVKVPDSDAVGRPANNIVIVVDESVRGDHLSLNGYARSTTPFLEELASKGILTNFGIACSASTGSRFTYNALIAGLTPDDFPDRTELKTVTFPTIFQYAKAMKYNTYFFDGQMNSYWGANGQDKEFLDVWEGPTGISEGRQFEPAELDNMIARKVGAIISASAGNLIFVFKHGSHVPYQMDFPASAEVWQPSYRSSDKFDIPSGDDLIAAANAYDNSLHFNIDQFFKNLVNDYSNIPNNSVIIYTGDHGQTLFVNGRAAHGGATKEEATVPLFLVGKLPANVDTRYKASHQNILPTVLDLMNYPAELRDWSAVPSLLKAKASDSKPRSFNPDLGPKVAFD